MVDAGAELDGTHHVFELAGFSSLEGALYLLALEEGRTDPTHASERLGVDTQTALALLTKLREKGYLAHNASEGATFAAVDPRPIMASAADALTAHAHIVRGAAPELFARFQRGKGVASDEVSPVSQLTSDPSVVAGWYAQLQLQATEQVRVFDRPPYISRPMPDLEERSIRSGVLHRALYTPESFDRAGAWAELGRSQASGESGRIVGALPVKMAIADASAAVVCLSLCAGEHDALLTSSPPLIAVLAELFELYWDRGVELPQPEDMTATVPSLSRGTPPRKLTPQEQAIISLIAGGAADEQIALRLGISVRSVRRRTSGLMAELGATNRFQFGVLASRRQWV